MDGLTEGRIVHYVSPIGEHLAAVVVRVWNKETGTVNLQVFTDGLNTHFREDRADRLDNVAWCTSVVYSDDKQPNSWHWIEKA